MKQISTLPANYTKEQVADMVRAPDGNEMPLRQVAHALEWTAYPVYHMRRVYQDLLTYRSYFSPAFLEEKDAKKEEFWREWRLLEKLKKAFRLPEAAMRSWGRPWWRERSSTIRVFPSTSRGTG